MSFEIPSIASAKTTLLISAASVCLVASTSSVAAQPFIKYQDNNPNPGMFNAGSSFDIDLCQATFQLTPQTTWPAACHSIWSFMSLAARHRV